MRRLLIVSDGIGLDSTGMQIEMHRRGIRPDIIMFADTGGEKPETYAYIETRNAWLRSVGFPELTIVRYEPSRALYRTLEQKCVVNETLPSLAFGGHSCALIFKRDVMVKALKKHPLVLEAIAQGVPIVKAIGYDNAAADLRRSAKAYRAVDKIKARVAERKAAGRKPLADQWEAAHCEFWYPLQDWGIDREELERIIVAAGEPIPPKSACWFCPASKPAEVVELKNNHPDLYKRAVAMEDGARNGRHGLTKKAGLGMGGWAWGWLEDCDDPAQAADFLKARGAKVSDGLRP